MVWYNLVLKCIESTAMHPFLTPRSCAPRQFGQDVSVTNSWQVGVFDDDHLRHFWRDPLTENDLFNFFFKDDCSDCSDCESDLWWQSQAEPVPGPPTHLMGLQLGAKNLRSLCEKSTSIDQHYQVSTRSVPECTRYRISDPFRKTQTQGHVFVACCSIL